MKNINDLCGVNIESRNEAIFRALVRECTAGFAAEYTRPSVGVSPPMAAWCRTREAAHLCQMENINLDSLAIEAKHVLGDEEVRYLWMFAGLPGEPYATFGYPRKTGF